MAYVWPQESDAACAKAATRRRLDSGQSSPIKQTRDAYPSGWIWRCQMPQAFRLLLRPDEMKEYR